MVTINKYSGRLAEFGFDYHKVRYRLSCGNAMHPPILANAIPKSGTNLLLRLLILLPAYSRILKKTLVNIDSEELHKLLTSLDNGKFVTGHVKFSQSLSDVVSQTEVKHIILIRDPLDVVLSNVKYITYIDKSHRLNSYFSNVLKNDSERFLAILNGIESERLNGDKKSLSIAEHYSGYIGWLDSKNCLVLRFEDLIGPLGGGDESRQKRVLADVLKFLNLPISDASLEYLSKNLFSPSSRTFFRGQIGSWRKFVKDNELEPFVEESEVVQLACSFGYEVGR